MTPRTVVFKPSFIKHALYQCLQAGEAHVEIFREVGIDVDVLVKEGLKMAFGNWLTKHKRGIPIGMPPPTTTMATRRKPNNRHYDAAPPRHRDEQEEDILPHAEVLTSLPAQEGRPAQADRQGHHDEFHFSNKLNRHFAVSRPGLHLLTDVSWLRCGGLCSLSAAGGTSTNEIVAWEPSGTVGLPFVLKTGPEPRGGRAAALPGAPAQRPGMPLHVEALPLGPLPDGHLQSMSRKGNCWGNAPMES